MSKKKNLMQAISKNNNCSKTTILGGKWGLRLCDENDEYLPLVQFVHFFLTVIFYLGLYLVLKWFKVIK